MRPFIPSEETLNEATTTAVQFFWRTRHNQQNRQQTSTRVDYGNRGAVTGGKQMDGFVDLIREIMIRNGVSEQEIYTNSRLELPGFYRPTKQWDIVVVRNTTSGNKQLIAAIELKSQVGSFGNNFNNRTEEAMGSSLDLWTAYRDGAFGENRPPWLGYLMLIEESDKATRTVGLAQPHFNVFPEFINTSYAKRYEIFCRKLVSEQKYTSACFLMSEPYRGLSHGVHRQPANDLNMNGFIRSLIGQLIAQGYGI